MGSSPKRKLQLTRARRNKQKRIKARFSKIELRRFALAVLTEGLGETQARRFLAKLNIKSPGPNAFYREQDKLADIIEKIVEDDFKIIQSNLPPCSIFGLDCSWSGRRENGKQSRYPKHN